MLTEYEEHRLRANIAAGTPLYRVRARFPLTSIDKGLDELKLRAKPLGEIITYLPTGSSGDDDSLELDILFASNAPIEQLRLRVDAPGVNISSIPKRGVAQATSDRAKDKARNSIPSVSPPADDEDDADLLPPPPKVPRGAGRSSHASASASASPSSTADRGTDRPPPRVARESTGAYDKLAPRDTPVPPSPKRMTPAAPKPDGTAGGGGGAEGGEGGGRAIQRGTHSVRVDIRRLDHLMNVLGEFAIVRGALSRLTDRVRQMPGLRDVTTELHRLNRAFERNLAEMQSGILEVRMVPLGQVFERLARAVRQISRANNKEIRLVITGSDTEVDKLIVEELSDPLLHTVRNSIDHGIESADERARIGKPAEGTIALNAYQAGNHVMIEIEDDGAGIDEARVLSTAVRRGIVRDDEARDMSRREIIGLIFLPGFSTRENVTDLSGRGVGLDVVKTNISRLGGVVDVTSEMGIGTKFTITLPITLAILRALLLGVAGRQYALPLSSVAEATVLDLQKIRTVEGREITSLRGETSDALPPRSSVWSSATRFPDAAVRGGGGARWAACGARGRRAVWTARHRDQGARQIAGRRTRLCGSDGSGRSESGTGTRRRRASRGDPRGSERAAIRRGAQWWKERVVTQHGLERLRRDCRRGGGSLGARIPRRSRSTSAFESRPRRLHCRSLCYGRSPSRRPLPKCRGRAPTSWGSSRCEGRSPPSSTCGVVSGSWSLRRRPTHASCWSKGAAKSSV